MPPKKKLQKFCRIYPWVKSKDEALAGAITDLCMEGALSTGRRTSGTTFLFPTEGVRKQIVDKAYSDDAEEAITLIEAHIIPDAVRTAAEFRKGVGSRARIKLEVEDGTGSTVTLKNGAKLSVAKDFKPLRKDNICVWEVDSGEVPLEGPEFETATRGRGKASRPKTEVTGGDSRERGSRGALASAIESSYNACMKVDHCRSHDPYLSHSVSLLNFLSTNYPDDLVKVLPMIDRDPMVTFYLLVEPYKTKGSDYVLSDSVLFGPKGWNGATVFERAITEFRSYFEMSEKQTAPSAEDRSSGDLVVPFAFRNPTTVRSAVDNMRLNILGDDGRKSNKVNTPKGVCAAYESLAKQNAIDGIQPVLPDVTLAALPGSKKLWQDELRFMVHAAMEEIRGMPEYLEDNFSEVISMLRFHRPGNDYASEVALASLEELRNNVAPQAEFTLLLKFINSTDFLYIPVSEAKVGGEWGEIPVASGEAVFLDVNNLDVYNAEDSKNRYLARLEASGLDAPQALDAGSIARIQHYVAQHGALPPGIGGAGAGAGGE